VNSGLSRENEAEKQEGVRSMSPYTSKDIEMLKHNARNSHIYLLSLAGSKPMNRYKEKYNMKKNKNKHN